MKRAADYVRREHMAIAMGVFVGVCCAVILYSLLSTHSAAVRARAEIVCTRAPQGGTACAEERLP
jgi:hypothetical protein